MWTAFHNIKKIFNKHYLQIKKNKLMRKIQIIAFLIIAVLLYSCNKKTENTEKTNEIPKTENTKKDDNPTTLKLYKMESVEESTGKNIAPNFTWTEGGAKRSLKDLKGKVIFINFWATWCGPCKKEMPDLVKISEELKDKNFQMIGVNIFQQEKAQNIVDYLKANPLPYITIDANSSLVNAFTKASGSELSAVPTTFIVDKDGKIAETIVGSRDKDTYMKLINKHLN